MDFREDGHGRNFGFVRLSLKSCGSACILVLGRPPKLQQSNTCHPCLLKACTSQDTPMWPEIRTPYTHTAPRASHRLQHLPLPRPPAPTRKTADPVPPPCGRLPSRRPDRPGRWHCTDLPPRRPQVPRAPRGNPGGGSRDARRVRTRAPPHAPPPARLGGGGHAGGSGAGCRVLGVAHEGRRASRLTCVRARASASASRGSAVAG